MSMKDKFKKWHKENGFLQLILFGCNEKDMYGWWKVQRWLVVLFWLMMIYAGATLAQLFFMFF